MNPSGSIFNFINTGQASAIRYAIAPLWARWEGSPYLRHLKILQNRQGLSRKEIIVWQQERLVKLLQHAYENTSYYHKLFDDCGVHPQKFDFKNDFGRIPVLTKNSVRLNKDQMVARNFTQKQRIAKKTSGSTGVSLNLFMDVDCSEWRRAVAIFRNSWTGSQLGERVAAIWGNPPTNQGWRAWLRNALLDRCFYLDTLGMDEARMVEFLLQIQKYKPTLMMGHAYSLYYFARFVQKQNKLYKFHLKGIISTAMILHPWQRQVMEEVFQCRVFNRYGCEEVSLIASECAEHQGMHVNTDSLIVEFVKDGRFALPGEEAAVVVTDLMNYGMPFIRYQIGDQAVFTDKICPCGRNSSLIEKVTGRDADFIVTPDGRTVSGISLTENFSLKIPGIGQMQIEQVELARLRIKIVRDQEFTDESERILKSLSQKLFGQAMQYELVFVHKIPQEKNGKYRFVISRLTEKNAYAI